MCTHACSPLIKMEHITQSSCEDKSLHLCCFDYPHSVSGHLPPSCSFSMRRKLYQSSRHWARSPAGEQRQSRLAAIQTASSSLPLMTDISQTLLPVLLFVDIHIISQWTPDSHLHDNRRMSVPDLPVVFIFTVSSWLFRMISVPPDLSSSAPIRHDHEVTSEVFWEPLTSPVVPSANVFIFFTKNI